MAKSSTTDQQHADLEAAVSTAAGLHISTMPELRSDSDIQHSRPPITVTPFWGPGLSAATASAAAYPSTDAPSTSQVNSEASTTLRPQRFSRDGNLTTSRDASQNNSREGSNHGSSNLWQFSRNISDDVLRSMFYKKLCWRLGAGPAKESLIATALQASSTGIHLLAVLRPVSPAQQSTTSVHFAVTANTLA